VAAPDTFRGAPNPPAADSTSLADLKWFEVFKDAQLQELVKTALTGNYDLRDAVVRVDAARASLGVTRADQFPNVGAAADITTLRNPRSGSIPLPPGFEQRRTFGSVTLDLLSFELDLWGRLRRATEAARAELLASEENRKVVVTTLVSEVAGAHFNLLEQDGELEIAKRTLATREESLRLIQDREQHGLATRLDVRQGEQLVRSAQQTIPNIEQTIAQTENQISLLLGRNPGSITRGQTLTQQEQRPTVPTGLPSALLERRPDIRQAEAQLASSNFSVEAARAAFFPQIQLTGTTGFQSAALASLFTPGAWFYTLTASLTQPIFDGFLLESQLKLAKGVQLQNLQAYRKAVLSAFSDVEKALIALQKFTLQEKLQNDVVTASRKAFDVAETQLRGGTVNLITVLQTQQTLFTAENTLVQVRLSKLLAASSLFQALGGGWTPAGTLAALQPAAALQQ